MDKDKVYAEILKAQLVPAFGCTEPIAIAYCAAKSRELLGKIPEEVRIVVSPNIIKNVKSVIVPNTAGLKGIEAAASAGIVAGDADRKLEVISGIDDAGRERISDFLTAAKFIVKPAEDGEKLDIRIDLISGENTSAVRIAGHHTDIVYMEQNGNVLCDIEPGKECDGGAPDYELLNMEDIIKFADSADLSLVKDVLDRQIECNMAIAEAGINENWGAGVGKTLLQTRGKSVRTRAIAYAAAGSDARMSGCELPVVINSGSGNQGITACVPVVVYARDKKLSAERLYRALIVSNLTAIHIKTGIGALSAFCGAVSAGCAAGCGIAYLMGGGASAVAHTLVNGLAIASGLICDGAKPSCAGKIAVSVEAGLLGYEMFLNGRQFYGGEGIVVKGVENTIKNLAELGSRGMQETDHVIIQMMTDC